uniref:Uncharacterized protein n=1 Tax=Megaselia scalaris TaxID=36166 RepID=T1GHI9_MEGSC
MKGLTLSTFGSCFFQPMEATNVIIVQPKAPADPYSMALLPRTAIHPPRTDITNLNPSLVHHFGLEHRFLVPVVPDIFHQLPKGNTLSQGITQHNQSPRPSPRWINKTAKEPVYPVEFTELNQGKHIKTWNYRIKDFVKSQSPGIYTLN